MSEHDELGHRPALRHQRWARHAYGAVGDVAEGQRNDYRIVVNGLGATILRLGLASAMAELERQGKRGKPVLCHLAGAGFSGLEGVTGDQLPARVRAMDIDAYVIVSREMLQFVTWLRRAVQATMGEL